MEQMKRIELKNGEEIKVGVDGDDEITVRIGRRDDKLWVSGPMNCEYNTILVNVLGMHGNIGK